LRRRGLDGVRPRTSTPRAEAVEFLAVSASWRKQRRRELTTTAQDETGVDVYVRVRVGDRYLYMTRGDTVNGPHLPKPMILRASPEWPGPTALFHFILFFSI
jgi:hypothetical protein